MSRKRVLFLVSELMEYWSNCITHLSQDYECDVSVIKWTSGTLHNQNISFDNFTVRNKDEFSIDSLKEMVINLDPDIIYIPGWQDKDYLRVVYAIRGKVKSKVVMGIDHQLGKGFKEILKLTIVSFVVKKLVDFIWIPGFSQYSTALALNFSKNQIIYNIYSGNTYKFREAYLNSIHQKQSHFPRKLIYVGRFAKVKNIQMLIDAFEEIEVVEGINWKLEIIGKGDEKFKILSNNIQLRPYVQPNEIVELIKDSGVFVLPSIKEPWGVVIHEFAAAGLPILCSRECGARFDLVIENYNGILIEELNIIGIKKALVKLFKLSEQELNLMSKRSYELSQRITPQTWGANLMSTLS